MISQPVIYRYRLPDQCGLMTDHKYYICYNDVLNINLTCERSYVSSLSLKKVITNQIFYNQLNKHSDYTILVPRRSIQCFFDIQRSVIYLNLYKV